MTKNELNRFRAVLTARVAELARVTGHREVPYVRAAISPHPIDHNLPQRDRTRTT